MNFDPLLSPHASVEDLGVVTAPSGMLILIDGGMLNFWSHDRPPQVEAGTLSDPRLEGLINTSVDLMVNGPDAVSAGLKFDRPVASSVSL